MCHLGEKVCHWEATCATLGKGAPFMMWGAPSRSKMCHIDEGAPFMKNECQKGRRCTMLEEDAPPLKKVCHSLHKMPHHHARCAILEQGMSHMFLDDLYPVCANYIVNYSLMLIIIQGCSKVEDA